jgi:hypothetical protein
LKKDAVTLCCKVKYKGKEYSKEITICKQKQGPQGYGIESQTTYYALVAPSYTAGQLLTPENSDEGLKIKDISKNNLYQKGHAIIEI